MKVGIGHSEIVDSVDAIQEALNQCKQGLGESKPDVGILFSAVCYEYSSLLTEVEQAFPGIQLIGCTTDGELSSVNLFLEDSLVLICMSSDSIRFSSGSGTKLSVDHQAAVKSAIDEAIQGLDCKPKLCITYYDSLTASGTVVLDSLQSQLGEDILIFGGVAGEQWELKSTHQFHNQTVMNDAITVLLIGGEVSFSTGVATGRQPFGQTFIITKSENNIVYEIDNQSAIEFYKKYVGNYSQATSENPLAILIDESKNFYLRSPFVFNENGSIVFAADVTQGAKVQLTSSTQDTIVKAVETASNSALRDFPGEKIDLALISSCASRRLLLGSRVKEEVEILKSLLPSKVGIGGFYAYGEICPIGNTSHAKFHNETFMTLLLGEK